MLKSSFLHPRPALAKSGLAIALLTCVLVNLSFANVAAQSSAVVRIDPASSTLQVGATAVANVRIENVSNLAGAEVHLSFDASRVQVLKIEAGGFPPPDFVAQSSFANGKIDYAIAVMPQQHQPVNGSGVLLKITLQGLAVGQSPLNFSSVILAAAGGSQINSTSQNGVVTVTQSGTQPSVTPTSTATQPSSTQTPSATSPPGAAVLKMVPPSLSLLVNNRDIVKVSVDNPTNLWGIDLRVTFDPSIVACINPPDKGTVPKPEIVAKDSCGNGLVEYLVTQQAPSNPANASGDVVLMTFQCLTSGTSALHFDRAKLVDRDGRDLPATSTDGQIICSQMPPSPTPTFTTTPAPTSTPIPPTLAPTSTPLPPSQILGYHVVRAGETAYCIARAYGVSPWAIVTQNGLSYPYWVSIGQTLAIPNVPWQVSPGPVCARQFGGGVPPTVVPPPRCRVVYYVRYGDTLYSIARRYWTTVERIVAANGLANANWIWAGQWLCIP